MIFRYVVVGIGLALVRGTYAVDCPDGFVSHQGVCYKEFGIRASWDEANVYCEAYGAELATVADQVEQTFLAGYLQRLTQGFFNSGIFWLGASDMAAEGSWVWNKTGSSVSYTNWKDGEPNNANGGEDCLTITFSDSFRWNDNNCNNKFNFVCEKRGQDLGIIG
ncbi:perlucin-like [Mercenaria mercenaria]|uniref:perlucin-like n=1 Tax=Mercenaria mercenaria TaxID=6596 RepID=UPI00234EEF51|nr:perlucin-like [Mercenaria mercenaria]